jgi:cytochrome c
MKARVGRVGRVGRRLIAALGAAGAVLLLCAQPPNGKEVFERRCTGCHSLDLDKEGPRLRGVYGRPSAATPAFEYSEPLRKARLKWDDGTLDKWLSNPDALVPGTDMAFRVIHADERAAIIAYLKTVK